jgi:hypothetical protein
MDMVSKKDGTMEIGKIGEGALQELFQREFDRAMLNVFDLNTSFKPVRKVIVELSITTNENRTVGKLEYEVKSRLAAAKKHETNLMFGRDETGKPIAREFGNQVAGQTKMAIVTPIKPTNESEVK